MIAYTMDEECLGLHRVIEPKGVLPQAATKLDAVSPMRTTEMEVYVESLHLDAASFKQIKEEMGEFRIADRVLKIVNERGKMHNPVTGSGGVFLGRVHAIGADCPHRNKVKVGDKIVSLVSLTLTPLEIHKIHHVDVARGELRVEGRGILFGRSLYSVIPEDLPENTVLAGLDICGAPAMVERYAKPRTTALLIGLGKAGKASALQAVESGANVLGIDADPHAVNWCRENIPGYFDVVNATNAVAVREWVKKHNAGLEADLVIQVATVPETEMGAILACKDGGTVIFFGMNTSFSRAVLGAEGLGRDITLLMGNGYVPGHAELMLGLLRKHKILQVSFAS